MLTIKNNSVMVFLYILILIPLHELFPQITPAIQLYRDDLKGDVQYRRESVLDINRIRTLFYNNGEVGQWPFKPSGEWPKGSGHNYIDGVAILITAEIAAPGNSQIVHPLETSYREFMDRDPVTGLIWGLEPVPGYSNSQSYNFAMSNDSTTWPFEWPAALNLPSDWNGHWYSHFGRDMFYADQESFFVMDDSKDKEWTGSPYNYYPIESDHERGGLGLRVEVRSFQWDSLLIDNVIFWHYDIINISDNNYPKTYFGFFTDPGVGGEYDGHDDCAGINTYFDLTYFYDNNGIGSPENWNTGYYGYAYLETPGNSSNGIDDDEDGMIDERRDDGIDNDGDWKSFTDLNENSTWDPENEPLNDDVGMDGLAPGSAGYIEMDSGEGDGIPTTGEPNFDMTDKDESDQIGLTAVSVYRLGDGGTGGGWPKDDEQIWNKMSYGSFDTTLQNANISMVFSSGPLPLNQGARERFSVALLFGDNLEDIINTKKSSQLFYNSSYKFPVLITSVDEDEIDNIVSGYNLSQNYPNPFNPVTRIEYSLPTTSLVRIEIYNQLGELVEILVNTEKSAGHHRINWNAKNISSGVYFYRIIAGNYINTKKMIILR